MEKFNFSVHHDSQIKYETPEEYNLKNMLTIFANIIQIQEVQQTILQLRNRLIVSDLVLRLLQNGSLKKILAAHKAKLFDVKASLACGKLDCNTQSCIKSKSSCYFYKKDNHASFSCYYIIYIHRNP